MDELPRLVIAGHPWTFWLGWVWTISSVILTTWIILQRKSPVSTLAWIMVLNLLPVVGLIVYAYFGPQRIKRQRLRRWHKKAALMSREDMSVLRAEYTQAPLWASQHAQLIEAACGLPMSSAQSVDILPSGGATLDALLREIEAARSHIHLEYYIFEPDQTGTRLLQALAAKARQDVHVRLLVDAIGSPHLLSRRHRRLLHEFADAGGEFAVFHPTRLDRLRPLVNLRTHRKIVVIDGHTGFVGGINVTDDENEQVRPDHAYRDTHLLIRGGAVRWLQYVFLRDWHYAEGDPPAREEDLLPEQAPGRLPVQIVTSGPDSDTEAIHRAMIDALNLARERIWLATPYFVPTESALNAITNAAYRGVQVKLIVPERSDSRIVTAAARSYYHELQDAGVLVFEYRGRMFHAKTLLVDELYGMVGSANFDNRSFRLNFEVAAVVLDRAFNERLAGMFEHDLSKCRLVPLDRQSPPHQRLFEAVARLASPLL
ncbi:cardiolipin synthase [Ottowia sp.]|uniref:cardiolipin synthase n=1 Tax=Ottowia sp. TaxID=1898956 RepID=UPI002B9E9B0E|nr:cardiolipin synthase [Ottowia sp.]HRN76869.1 cardiolipin synthase [Ottowia sp.]HRQ03825.1 cardiolipin synthase [Ottowia sp.]